jgi:hypothetical protein
MELVREVNVRIHELVSQFDEPSEYLCECARSTCREKTLLRLHPTEFADVRAMPRCFVVARGHRPAGSIIVRDAPEYLIVRVGPPE